MGLNLKIGFLWIKKSIIKERKNGFVRPVIPIRFNHYDNNKNNHSDMFIAMDSYKEGNQWEKVNKTETS